MRRAVLLAAAGALAATPLSGQTLASRINAVRDGVVLISYAARPGVCGFGDGNGWTDSRHFDGQRVCVAGPVRVSLGRSENTTVSARVHIGGAWHAAPPERDFGIVSAPEAARYLMSVAHAVGGRSSGDALAAATFADSVNVSPELMRLVRDADAPIDARKNALFWLGQSETPTADLLRLYDGLQPFALREHYTFVLSQRREDATLDKLIDVARHDPDLEIRKRALFWLGQSNEPKAINFLRDVITR
jgi:hypothetical protein